MAQTLAQLTTARANVQAAIDRQEGGLARHSREDREYVEPDLKILYKQRDDLDRKISRAGTLPSERGKWQ